MKRKAPKTSGGAKVVFLFEAAIKKIWGSRVTTVFVRQGHYARDAKLLASQPPADVIIERIGDLLGYRLQELKPNLAKSSRRMA